MKKIFNALDKRIKQLNIPKRELATLLGVHRTTLYRWWKKQNIPATKFFLLLDHLKMNLVLHERNRKDRK